MATKFVHGKPYTWPALTLSNGKEVAKPKNEAYLFDISKVDQIFDCFMKDKQTKLPEGHKIPPTDEIKGKKYCKWHHSWTHMINNCTVFRNAIQKALKEGRLKLAKKEDMTMVSVPITWKEHKENKALRWENKLKEKDEARPS